MKMDRLLSPRTLAFGLLSVAFAFLSGCSTQQFYANYYIDPKPAKVDFSELVPPVDRQPVYLVFDMYSSDGSFPEATRKLAPKVAQAIRDSRLFSTVSKVGSENMARIQISMRETGVLSGTETKTMPQGLTALPGSKGVITYSFTAQYQAPGKEAVKKTYPHAVHLVPDDTTGLGSALPATAGHAVDKMVEQVVLNFLRDLQRERKL
jgi:hypothetical protein